MHLHRLSGKSCCACILDIGFSEKYSQKKTDALLEGCRERDPTWASLS